ncbi:TPA: helix-turn-helix transcriptional regulator [Streptococcus pyogenes]|uniref:helix-turn-helix domain-containing protein n=1 Tax=Streptococcus pyogenes TaxID=1314 RepID=UPI00109C2632|nr:helix-turn-helix transcriptional regulator [Streptococcus pyogenes]VGU99356.1 XRE family transcriptional regulator [Streptococcus pyogenes]VGY34159.1 XRE family transcriptional regulator [Streptococcus pyogenes]VHE45937.1 XRE family transcriptional regulator [Streptococcus pyogenes]VHF43234.1 XRE family transcriptional regulator [Streptococcus pyogenes]VHH01917.1 XRE family transcriptional regulator [Streptococcus pyogenes]
MNRLKELRKEKKVSQKEIADFLGISEKTISRWENSENTIKSDKAQKLADFFEVSVKYLLGYSDDKKDPMLTSLELARKDDTGDYFDLQDMVTLMDIAMLKSVDTRDKILSNLKEYYDYYGVRMKEEHEIKDDDKFNAFLAEFQEDTNDYIIMLLTGIVKLRDDIRFTILDILAMEGEKLETVKNIVKFISDNDDN